MVAKRPFQLVTRALAAVLAGAAVWGAAPAFAQAGATMTVTATVVPRCDLQAGAMAFGSIDATRSQNSAESALALDCTPGTAFTVTMDQGQNGSRRMAALDGGDFLDYEIYRDAAATQPWTTGVSGVAPTGGKVLLSAYGRVTGQNARPGSYQDVVTVTVEF